MPTVTGDWVGVLLTGNRYQVTAKLGEGGMGHVYRAHDRNLDAEVVIKVPRQAMMADPDFAGRFAREIRSLVKLVHPHIVKVMDVGEQDGLPFAVMQYLSGGSLRDRQQSGTDGAPMRPDDLRGWLEDVASALDFIHRKNYIHRDIKPDNILFDAEGHAYLSDFGVAKVLAENTERKQKTVVTGAGMVLGTPQFMAPELILGQPYDGRADQYALAVMVYELLSGRYPFDGNNSTAIFVQTTTQEPPPLDSVCPALARGVAAAVHRGLAKEPGERFPDCASFARAVFAGIGQSPAPTGKASSAMIKVTCPGCQKVIGVPIAAQGKPVRCPACGTPFQAPERRTHQALPTGRGEQAKIDTRTVRVSRPPPTSSQGAATTATAVQRKKKPKNTMLPWILGGVGLLAVVLIVVFGFALRRPKTEATTIWEARKSKVENKADHDKLAKVTAVPEKVSGKKEGAEKTDAAPIEITSALLKRKFQGEAAYDLQTDKLTLKYDFKKQEQLRDFELGDSKPRLNNGFLTLEPGERVKHLVRFKGSLILTGTVRPGRHTGTHLGTSEGIKITVRDFAGTRILIGNKELAANGNCPNAYPWPFELKILRSRVAIRIADVSLGNEAKDSAIGQVEFFSGDAGNGFGQLVMTGELDPEWAKEFFAK